MSGHLASTVWMLGLGLGLGLLGCPDRITGAVDCSDSASAGLQGCPCLPDGRCGEGLKCSSGVCGEPGIETLGNVDASEDASAGDGSTTGADCTPGAKGCGCVEGTCGLGLRCIDDTCELDDGATGTDGATEGDTEGGGDDGDACAEDHIDPCYVDGELRECCGSERLCVGSETDNACEPSCRAHSECSHCCAWVETMVGKYCSPNSAFCGDVLCIDTCGPTSQDGEYAADGYCDDRNGLTGCEYGTDCADCGPREPKEMARVVDSDAARVVAHEYRRGDHAVRILFEQPVDVSHAADLITIFDDRGDQVSLRLRESRIHAFKGVAVPAGHIVIATWKSRLQAPARDLQLHVTQDGAPDDYRATLRARSGR